jgi:hypothetical protein
MKLQTSSWPPDNFSNFDTNNSAQLHQIQLSIFHYLGHFLLLLLTRELTLLLVIMVCLGKDRTRLCKIPKKISQNQPQHFYFFISHQSLFITSQIKKKSLQNKKFHFSMQNILTFFLTSIKSVIVPVHFLQSSLLPNIAITYKFPHVDPFSLNDSKICPFPFQVYDSNTKSMLIEMDGFYFHEDLNTIFSIFLFSKVMDYGYDKVMCFCVCSLR